jgi:hypothetical protein
MDWMSAAGFERLDLRLAEEVRDPKYGPAVLDDPFLAKNACSQLALLSDAAYEKGLRRIRLALAQAGSQGKMLVFQNTLQIHRLVGFLDENTAI